MSAGMKWVFALSLLIILCTGAWWVFFPNVLPVPPEDANLTPTEAQEIAQKFQQSLGRLENSDYEGAATLLAELAGKLPEERSVHRNQALNYLIGINALTGEHDPQKVARREELIAALQQSLGTLQTFPEERLPWAVFSARLALIQEQESQAIEFLQQAAAAAPGDAAFTYEISRIAFDSADAALHDIGLTALEAAHLANPSDLWILPELLLRQADAKSPRLAETLTAAESALAVVQPGILERTRVDVVDLVKQANNALAQGDANLLLRNVRILSNVLRPEDAAQSDKIQLEKHPLTFVALQLSPELAEIARQAVDIAAAPTTFDFSALKLAIGPDSEIVLDDVIDIAVGDFDLTGTDDLCILHSTSVQLLGRTTPSDPWQRIATATFPPDYEHVLAVDLDADEREARTTVTADLPGRTECRKADMDLVLYGTSGVLLLKNQLATAASTRTLETVSLTSSLTNVSAVVAVDVDIDGDLDLLVATADGSIEQWSNQTQWKFGLRSGTPAEVPSDFAVQQFLPVDIDRDVDIDVLVVSTDGRCGWLENLRHGLLRFRELHQGNTPITGTCLAVTDWNADATWDLFVGSEQDVRVVQGISTPEGQLTFLETAHSLPAAAAFLIADFDNDGQEDLLSRTAVPSLHRLQPNQQSVPLPIAALNTTANIETLDVDQDGDLDLVLVDGGNVQLLQNNTPETGGWFHLSLVANEYDPNTPAISSHRMNHYAIGSTVEIRTGTRYQSRVVTGAHTYFGLGSQSTIDTLRVIWTNGIPQHHLNPPVRALLCEPQIVIGSCPYLYACNSRGTEFVTDLLWAAPLGLPSPTGDIIPDRPWEYIKIPGEMLEPIGGRYRLQVTEELRETAYFDQVQLFAVDHPVDTEIFTNEKVGPAELATHRLHSVTQLLTPSAAHNQHGRDLQPEIARRDDNYARPYDDQLAHGLTEPTHIELLLELPPDDDKQPLDVKLVLTGWLHPPDAGVSVAIHESVSAGSSEFSVPQPLSLWVPDAAGEWIEAIPFTGFVGGKTKTIVLDIGSALNRDDPRVQLRTSMEFAWDQIGYTVNEPPQHLEEVELKLVFAHLHGRGISSRQDHPRRGPDRYDYSHVVPGRSVGSLFGRFTRYGDVLPLLTSTDNLLVVEGPGDEMTLEFEALPQPAPGLKRDFVMRNVGWDKDAQMHVVYGQSSEPLPFHEMASYPCIDGPSESPQYLNYLREYQTRTLKHEEFRRELLRIE